MQMEPKSLYPFLQPLFGLFVRNPFPLSDFSLTIFKLCFDVKGMDNIIHSCFIWQGVNYFFGNIFNSQLIPPYVFYDPVPFCRKFQVKRKSME